MKKTTTLILGLIIAVSAFSQSDLTLNLCGNTAKTSVKQFEKCRSIEVNKDGYKVFGFKISFLYDDMVTEFKLEANELTDEVVKKIALHKPEKIYIENVNIVNVSGEAFTAEPLILTMEY